MALVIGLVAAAARAITSSNDHDRQNSSRGGNLGYNGNGQNYNNYNNNNNYNTSPYATYSPQMTGSRRAGRRMGRRMRKAERQAERNARAADLVMAIRGSSSRTNPREAVPQYPQSGSGGVAYMNYGDSSRSRAGSSSEPQGAVAGSYTNQMPQGGPEGYQWRDAQSRDRPVSRGDRHMGSSSSSTDNPPTYEQAVRKSGKS